MRGYVNHNQAAFEAATKMLRDLGHTVFSPAEHAAEMGLDVNGGLAADITWICLEADVIVLLPGWQMSLGVQAEFAVARAVSVPVVELGAFLKGAG